MTLPFSVLLLTWHSVQICQNLPQFLEKAAYCAIFEELKPPLQNNNKHYCTVKLHMATVSYSFVCLKKVQVIKEKYVLY